MPIGTRRASARQFPRWARQEIEDAIERLLGLLDQADGDADFEESDPAEDNDAAEDNDEDVDVVDQPHDVGDEGNDEPDNDGEPSLGGLDHENQSGWAAGNHYDLEIDEGDTGIADFGGLMEQSGGAL